MFAFMGIPVNRVQEVHFSKTKNQFDRNHFTLMEGLVEVQRLRIPSL